MNGVDTRLKEIIQEGADELCCEILELEVMADRACRCCVQYPHLCLDCRCELHRQQRKPCKLAGNTICIPTQHSSHIPGPATRAFKAMQQSAFGQHGRPRFKGYRPLDSVEGKTNSSSIRWQDGRVVWKELDIGPSTVN